jgi:hypothetical protein
MALSTQALQADLNRDDREDDWRLPGLELMHDFQISLAHWSRVGAIVDSLREADAEVQALSLTQHPNAVALRCRVRAISTRRARSLADAFCGGHAISASVEHLLLAKGTQHGGA